MKPIAAVLMLLFSACAVSHAHSLIRPNIVVIMTDDQDDTGSLSVMPKTRKLLKRFGVHFTNSFTDFPQCCPSRASLLTGLAAHNHGVRGSKPERGGGYEFFLPLEGNTLAVWLQNAGYTTAMMGKYLNGYERIAAPASSVPPGWNEWHAFRPPSYYNYEVNENGALVFYGQDASSYSTDMLTRKAVDFINRHSKRQPFFLLLTPKAPHTRGRGAAVPAPRHKGALPTITVPRYRGAFNEADVSDKPGFVQATPPLDDEAIADATARFRGARRSLLAVDDMVESIVGALGHNRLLRRTIIIFTSDNGYLFGAHRLIGKGVVYEGSIRVPLLIRGPGIPQNELRMQLVNNLDLAATIVELAGAVPPYELDGKSLLPIVKDSSAAWRTALLVQGVTQRGDGRFVAIRTANSIYAEVNSSAFGTEQEYYDLAADPSQTVNRAGDVFYQDKVAELQTLLTTLKSCSGATCWVTGDLNGVSGDARPASSIRVYRGPPPKLYHSRREYDIEQSRDE